ncbi:glycosyltransferase family 4 protein [Trebonia sp.]|uniref:glycosyltransferase family 4 protein n=1 Tax=Trebonia sp. TaxID=2767075 RepID=UPI00260B721E|nr:MraY family glycosyltransferase [Trebonia sp.]
MRDYLYVLIIAAVVTYLLTPLVRRASIAIGAMHAPRGRDVHEKPTPLLGGVAMYGGLVVGLLVAERLSYLRQAFPSSRTVIGLLLAGGLLVLIGALDDRFGMGVISRLAAQVAAGGILMWSGVYLPWVPLPGGQIFSLEPDLSATLTILIVVLTVNAVNFIDGLDGLAAGVVAIAGLSYLVYSYTLSNSVGIPSQSVPAVASAVLAGVCIGFLPHNFHPARVFMGDAGAYLLGLLLAYGPISSTASLDPNILINYSHLQPVNRFPTVLPLLLPAAILVIPYADLLLAVIRRTLAGKSAFAADGQHLHHRLLNMGHSHRQSVLIMYLWAALFSGTVVGLSQVRIRVIWLALATVGAMVVLLLATMPRLRPWRTEANGKQRAGAAHRSRSVGSGRAAAYGAAPANGAVPANGAAASGAAANGAVPANGMVRPADAMRANGPVRGGGGGPLPGGPVPVDGESPY